MKGILNMFPNGGLVIAKNEKLDFAGLRARSILFGLLESDVSSIYAPC